MVFLVDLNSKAKYGWWRLSELVSCVLESPSSARFRSLSNATRSVNLLCVGLDPPSEKRASDSQPVPSGELASQSPNTATESLAPVHDTPETGCGLTIHNVAGRCSDPQDCEAPEGMVGT